MEEPGTLLKTMPSMENYWMVLHIKGLGWDTGALRHHWITLLNQCLWTKMHAIGMTIRVSKRRNCLEGLEGYSLKLVKCGKERRNYEEV